MGTYHAGMFAHDGDNPDDVYYQAIYAHEAGHAVTGHILGKPCKYIRVGGPQQAVTKSHRRDNARVNAVLRRSPSHKAIPQAVIDEAITICAGPAAELRWCVEWQLPIRVLFGSVGDHKNAEKLFRWIMRQGLDCNGSFLDLAWDGAAALLADNWTAVKKLTAALEDGVAEGCGEFTMRSQYVAAICNQKELT
jgi:hypothetical protein